MPATPPTQAQVILMFRRVMAAYRQLRSWGGQSPTGGDVTELQRNVVSAIVSDSPAALATSVTQMRAAFASIYDSSAMLQANLRDWARLVGVDATAPLPTILDAWYGYCVANSVTVVPRSITYGTPTKAAANTGSGTVLRLTVDARGYSRQGGYGSDKYIARCIAGQGAGGVRNSEVFAVYSRAAAVDDLEYVSGSTGLGVSEQVQATDPRTLPMINLCFDQYSGPSAGAPTSIAGWSCSVGVSGGNMVIVSGTAYLPARDSFDVVRSLKIKNPLSLTQRFDLAGVNLSQTVPYYNAIAYYPSGSGTLRLRVGAVSASAVISAGVTQPRILQLSQASGSYWRALASNPMQAQIVIDSGLTGSVTLSACWIAAPYTPVGPTHWFIRPGPTPFKAGSILTNTGDTFSATDQLTSTTIVIQRELGRLLTGSDGMPFMLPYAVSAGAATIAEPS